MSATGDRAASDGGATLLEMLVVVGVMGLIAGLVFPDFTHATRTATFERTAERLNGDLRLARAMAGREGHATLVELSSDGASYAGPNGTVSLEQPLRIAAEDRAIQFFADGSSSGGRWRLMDGGREAVVTVDDVTGVATSAAR